MPADVVEELIRFTERKYKIQEDKSLKDFVYANYLFAEFDEEAAGYLFNNKEKIMHAFKDEGNRLRFVNYCIEKTKKYTYERNQFINVNKLYSDLLFERYENLIDRILAALYSAELPAQFNKMLIKITRQHLYKLKTLFERLIAYSIADLSPNNPLINNVVSSEYSAELIIKILNLDLKEILQPVLDIGCGNKGALVKYLNEMGIEVTGIDRAAPEGLNFKKTDWFEYKFDDVKWGTIVAHQSISTQFIFNHIYNSKLASDYAGLFMQLLSTLKKDGSFYYAPGLPFFEEHLQKLPKYKIEKKRIGFKNDFMVEAISYSVQIKRI